MYLCSCTIRVLQMCLCHGCYKCICGVRDAVNLFVLYMYVYSEMYTYLLVLKVGKILAVEVKDKPSPPPALADSYNETTM